MRIRPIAAASAVLAAAACSSGHPAAAPATHAASQHPATSAAPSASGPGTVPPQKRMRVRLTVPAGLNSGALAQPHTLTLPPGWTASVWARVDDARMEAWTPQGGLLVSQPGAGTVTELVPRGHGVPSTRILLSGLTMPQGLAFARYRGREVLYVAESDQLDRYTWAGGAARDRTVVAAGLPDQSATGDDVHREKDLAVTKDGTIYLNVGSAYNASPADRTATPQRAVIMAVSPDGRGRRVVERGVRNGEGLAVAPDGTVWTAVNNRDNIPYPGHARYDGVSDPFGQVIQSYVNDHPPDEVVPVTTGRDLGWPYCDPDQDDSHPAGSLASVPFTPDAVTNPGGGHLDCARLPAVQAGLPAHSAPLGMSFLDNSRLPAPWDGGAVIAAHGSWDRDPPRAPAVLWLAWNAARRTLEPAVTLAGGFQNADGQRWGRPADAVPGPDGALYVSDDTAGAVYRLVPAR